MRWLHPLFWRSRKGKSAKAALIAKIEALGFRVEDQRGWRDGEFARRRYYLERGNETYGPFGALEDVFNEAKRLT